MRLVECVPNFSEGRDQKVIDAIAEAIKSVQGVSLLDVDPGVSTNRTVFTFVGSPEVIVEGAFQAIKTAQSLIDMRRHKGEHPRMGATDVCPFVPVAGVTMEDCVKLAEQLGERVGKELGIPVYLYAEAARAEDRKSLADIRKGEYEGLPEKMKDKSFKPDFGPSEFNAQSGATVIGARQFLIAYNVNLNTRSRKLANDIALTIREAGKAKRDAEGNIVKDKDGVSLKVPGTLKSVRAVGWYVDEYKRAQISIKRPAGAWRAGSAGGGRAARGAAGGHKPCSGPRIAIGSPRVPCIIATDDGAPPSRVRSAADAACRPPVPNDRRRRR